MLTPIISKVVSKSNFMLRHMPLSLFIITILFTICPFTAAFADEVVKNDDTSVFQRMFGWLVSDTDASFGDPTLYKEWQLPDIAPSPENNQFDERKIKLGKMLFFDPRLSGSGSMSCATCHDPKQGWSDGSPTARGHKGKRLERATPTIVNVGFNKILMWDGRAESLEDQALGPITNPDEMHNTVDNLVKTLRSIPGYVDEFNKAYYGLGISSTRIARAIAMYQRTIVVNNSPFDRYIRGDSSALKESQIRGLKIFTDPMRGNCSTCHRPPNFTDNGFHNIGLPSFNQPDPDLGRYHQKPVTMTRGAFKTPVLRNVALTAPYFHDGSAETLRDVIEHYATGGVVKSNLSPNMRVLTLSEQDKEDLVAFLESLTGDIDPMLTKVELPQ